MTEKTVTIITGGGRGIGRAIALRMARAGAVLVVGRTESDLVSVCAEITAIGGAADYIVGDVADLATAGSAIIRTRERGWAIANLVCNAGIAKGGPLVSFSPEVWKEMFDVNVFGVFAFARACLPEMLERKQGSVTIISSTLGLKGHKNDAAYSATKFALVGLAQSLAAEVKKHNIVVVPICPGFVDTEMTDRTLAGIVRHKGVSLSEAEKIVAAANPQGRILAAGEIAEAVAYCAHAGKDGDTSFSGEAMELMGTSDPRLLKLVNWVRENAAAAKELYIPVSGGSDSALALYVCARAYPGKVSGIYVGAPEELRGREWLENTAPIKYIQLPQGAVSGDHGSAEIWRWAAFLELSNSSGAWLVGSRNRTEKYTGLYSLASRVATFLPLANIWKSEVMQLCDAAGVPKIVSESSRRADPACGRPEELSEIALEKIDIFLQVHSGEKPYEALAALTDGQVEYLSRVVRQNAFKQDLPNQGPDLSSSN